MNQHTSKRRLARWLATVAVLVTLGLGGFLVTTIDAAEDSERTELRELYDRAMAARGEGRLADAVAGLNQALELAATLGDAEARVTLLVHLGSLHSSLGESPEAIARYCEARDLLGSTGDEQKRAVVLNALGFEQFAIADYAGAAENLDASLKLADTAGDLETRKATLRTLALCYRELADGETLRGVADDLEAAALATDDAEALAAARVAREIAETLLDGDKQWLGQVEYWKKILATPRLHLEGLDEIFDDAEARGWTGREEIETFDLKSNAMEMLSLLYQEKMRWDDAIEIGEDHVAHLQERGEPIEAARRLTLLAGDYQQAGKYGEGIRAVERALDQLAEVERPKAEPGRGDEATTGRALTLLEREAIRSRAERRLSLLYQQTGDIDSALASLGVHDCRLQVIGALDPGLQMQIARLCFEQGWDDSAHAAAERVRSLVEPALEASRRHQLLALDLLSVAAYVEGGESNWRIALDHTLEALEISRKSRGPAFAWMKRESQASVQERLAYLYANLGHGADALRYARQAITNASDDPFDQLLGHTAEGFVHLRAGRWSEAEVSLRQAASGWETLQASVADDERLRATLLDAQLATFELLQETLISSGRSAAALEVAERARARSLGAALAGDAGLDTLSIDTMRSLARRTGAALLSWSILYDPYRGPSTGRVRGRQADLERSLLIGLVTPAGAVHTARVDLVARRRAGEPSMERLIRDFRFTVDRREATRGVSRGAGELLGPLVDTTALRGLDALLIEPIREHLPSDPAVPLVLVPQGRLFQVPFAALRALDGQHLIECHPLLVVPSLAVLDLLAKRGEDPRPWRPNEVLVVGDPKYASRLDLEPLDSARSEAVEVAKLWRADPLLGTEATLGEVVEAARVSSTSRPTRGRPVATPTRASPEPSP